MAKSIFTVTCRKCKSVFPFLCRQGDTMYPEGGECVVDTCPNCETDIISVKPKRRYKIKAKIISVEKVEPPIIDPEEK